MDPFDPENFRSLAASPPSIPPRPRRGERFLKGPVPWDWLDRTALPGKTLAVGLVLWHRAGMAGQRTVRLALARAKGHLGLSEYSAQHSSGGIERAGLVSARRAPGRSLEVTILEVGPGQGPPPPAGPGPCSPG